MKNATTLFISSEFYCAKASKLNLNRRLFFPRSFFGEDFIKSVFREFKNSIVGIKTVLFLLNVGELSIAKSREGRVFKEDVCKPFNADYGLLGSNKATENSVKLFPKDCQTVVDRIQGFIKEATGKTVEVMVYGDGAFKDPVGKIWELADPVVSPAYTAGLEGQPNEIKLKYLADNDFADLSGDALKAAISERIICNNFFYFLKKSQDYC